MKHKGLRITQEQLALIRKRKSIGEVLAEHFSNHWLHNKVNRYLVPFEMVRTEDLIEMMRGLTIFTNFMQDIKLPDGKQLDRLAYLELLSNYSGITLTIEDQEFFGQLYRNKQFMDQRSDIFNKLKKELDTREHVPNKLEKKIVRKLKAQGKYIID
jgi:hypothetical protein